MVAWNAWHYDWLRGYDAFANEQYAHVVSHDYRLPSPDESGVWHTPPLWFALAGALGRLTTAFGWEHAQRPGQLLAAASGLAICILVLLLARTLWPKRRALHLVALVLVATSPVLVRASAMYHPETLAVALATGGVLVAVRALRTQWTPASAAVAGTLLGLACLTRAWALPVLIAVLVVAAVDAPTTRRAMPLVALAVVALGLLAPWLVNQQLAHGSALAFNRPAQPGSVLDRRPASFYVGPHTLRALEHPITPLARNELVPHLYADWWGDWSLSWAAPLPPGPGELLPASVVAVRARQMLVGALPSLLSLAGLVALGLLAATRRSASLSLLPLSALAVAGAFVLFAVRYPSTDGDTIKATYLLMLLPAGAVGAGLVIDVLRPRGRRWTTVGLTAAGVFVAVQLPFLVL